MSDNNIDHTTKSVIEDAHKQDRNESFLAYIQYTPAMLMGPPFHVARSSRTVAKHKKDTAEQENQIFWTTAKFVTDLERLGPLFCDDFGTVWDVFEIILNYLWFVFFENGEHMTLLCNYPSFGREFLDKRNARNGFP